MDDDTKDPKGPIQVCVEWECDTDEKNGES